MTVRGIIFDVDGTVVRGSEPLPGAVSGVMTVADRGLQRLFVSNNPTEPPTAYEHRLENAGFAVDATEVLTAGTVTKRYLLEHHNNDSIAVVGEAGLFELLAADGLSVTDIQAYDSKIKSSPDVLVASIDRSFDYNTLSTCLKILADDDVTFLGTDPDIVIPAAEGDIPGSGAIIGAIANVTGRDPVAVLGKPSKIARKMAINRLGLPPENILVVGDRLDTDIALGNKAGMQTVLVETGVTDAADTEDSSIDPDHIIPSLGELEPVLESLE
ncbi:HAD-IIA family hydrolase [Haloquadratum walsbyi]|jgi:Predicted sugar phosphatases of the HAD superfamily|uniref:Putative sugar phosphatases of the HAD superfamily n=1 Tax=Haloquadratum walsbyi J07HQW2 TaxID=1238425 RepID=U1NFJ4_9EURY|nr:HAD-IIA family hydrolase [Haloquadratum walsbyi]ERG95583.1 MAG: putative sugar phosphatases of the HAD superfamily [Haloquadratum walsbyi J07HQW2]